MAKSMAANAIYRNIGEFSCSLATQNRRVLFFSLSRVRIKPTKLKTLANSARAEIAVRTEHRENESMRLKIMRLIARLMFQAVFGVGFVLLVAGMIMLLANSVSAREYASVIMDARNGEILQAQNAEKRLHPASLTKMMTVYVAIQAVENGEITLDTMVNISSTAASEPPSKIGFAAGSQVSLRHLIRASAVRSANDAATAIAEAISGSEAAFTARMTRTAMAMGMTQTRFKNAHGLTQSGHMSTAMDMTILGRHVIYNYPQYYHLFSKRRADVGNGITVKNTNRRFLRDFSGSDGIKTGFTNAAGFNLTASATRGNTRLIVTVFGGRSGQSRDTHVGELMERGFRMAKANVVTRRPPLPSIPFGTVNRVDTTVEVVTRPMRRPSGRNSLIEEAIAKELLVASEVDQGDADPDASMAAAQTIEYPALVFNRPERRPSSNSDGGMNLQDVYGISIGTFVTRANADQRLRVATIKDIRTLTSAEKFIVERGGRFNAGFINMTPEDARKACVRLVARNESCEFMRYDQN